MCVWMGVMFAYRGLGRKNGVDEVCGVFKFRKIVQVTLK